MRKFNQLKKPHVLLIALVAISLLYGFTHKQHNQARSSEQCDAFANECEFIPAVKGNFDPDGNNHVKSLILHYTAESLAKTIEIFESSGRQVSSHYIVDTKGNIIQMVREKDRAYHAGTSSFDGQKGYNRSSIGIEIVNLGYVESQSTNVANCTNPFPEAQIAAVTKLSKNIIKRYGIESFLVLGHMDIAPARKIDPGPCFPWEKLAESGVGLFPTNNSSNIAESNIESWWGNILESYGYAPMIINQANIDMLGESLLIRYGYDTKAVINTATGETNLEAAKKAFQMHFNPESYIQIQNIEESTPINFSYKDIAILDDLLKQKNK